MAPPHSLRLLETSDETRSDLPSTYTMLHVGIRSTHLSEMGKRYILYLLPIQEVDALRNTKEVVLGYAPIDGA